LVDYTIRMTYTKIICRTVEDTTLCEFGMFHITRKKLRFWTFLVQW
jgi:hypothetical protein